MEKQAKENHPTDRPKHPRIKYMNHITTQEKLMSRLSTFHGCRLDDVNELRLIYKKRMQVRSAMSI